MTEEHYPEPVDAFDGFEEEAPWVDDAEIQQILAEYHRKQMIENMTGPGVSLVLHVIFLTLMFVFIVTKPRQMEPAIVVEMTEIEEVELEPEVIEEIEEIEEEIVEEEVPSTEPSEAPSDQTGAEDSLLDVSDDAPMTDDNVDADEVLDVVRTDSPLKFSGPLGGRGNAGRRNAVRKYGGSSRGQNAVNKALRWLARVQNENGSWGEYPQTEGHPGLTGGALLVFLAHGETPLSEQYGKTVQDAMRWLANWANREDIEKHLAKGHFGAYGHGLATYAISESYAMTKIPFMQVAMEKAVDIIIKKQQPNGGFDYGYKSGPRWDMSICSWNYQALKAARVAGCTNPKLNDAINTGIRFCKKVAYVADAKNSRFGYSNADIGAKGGGQVKTKPNMNGLGVVILQLLGEQKSRQVQEGLEIIEEQRLKTYEDVRADPKSWGKAAGNYLYGWYYDTQAVFNSQDTAGGKERWKKWRAAFEAVLIRNQHPEGYWQGEGWTFEKGLTPLGGKIWATCLCALQLEVYYRYLPTFDIKKMAADSAKNKNVGIDNVGAGNDNNGGLVIEID